VRYKVGDKVKIKEGSLAGNIYTISYIDSCGYIELSDLPCVFFDYELEPVDSKTLRMADGTVIGEFAKEGIIGEFKGMPVYATGGTVSIHDLPISEWSKFTFGNGSSIEAIPNEDAIRSKEPELVWIDKISLPTATETKEMVE